MTRTVTVTTIDAYPLEYEILGFIHTTVVSSKSMVGDMVANVKNWTIGGRLPGYEAMIDNAVKLATERISEIAEDIGADAVIAVKFCSTEVAEGAAELILYGTAVKHKVEAARSRS